MFIKTTMLSCYGRDVTGYRSLWTRWWALNPARTRSSGVVYGEFDNSDFLMDEMIQSVLYCSQLKISVIMSAAMDVQNGLTFHHANSDFS